MKKLSFAKVFLLLFLSVIFVSGPFYAGFFFYKRHIAEKKQDPSYTIRAILQTSQGKKKLSTQYLAEKMGLSKEKSENLFFFEEEEKKKCLESSPFIKEAIVKKMKPNTLYVKYLLREPVASIFDFENTLIDKEGVLFPNIFSEKLPEIVLGEEKAPSNTFWEEPLSGKKWDFAIEVLEEIQKILPNSIFLKRIDVSKAFLPSCGKKELVVVVQEIKEIKKKEGEIFCFFPKYLRLPVKGYKEQLLHFLSLNENMGKDYELQVLSLQKGEKELHFSSRIFDLRIKDLAFIEKE